MLRFDSNLTAGAKLGASFDWCRLESKDESKR